ncbi:hypothetical protein F3Y22_tig00110239pilonHSYRG00354 [Hibiscus syriacus]|uniref:VIN3-like fibronectin type-III domain-containing protein n=1 Tax=Hibiscus syriacus TaxID=106335 RepID=A0A6A3BAF0_HIBSY|nr:hypothetical protein F3Y22_tig00110239pilonHSYRG00354 [Hibiscus syriacus]
MIQKQIEDLKKLVKQNQYLETEIAMNKGCLEQILMDLMGRTNDQEPPSPETKQMLHVVVEGTNAEYKMFDKIPIRIFNAIPSITGTMNVDLRLQQSDNMIGLSKLISWENLVDVEEQEQTILENAQHFPTKFKEEYKIDVFQNNSACTRLHVACEKLKNVLSANPKISAPILQRVKRPLEKAHANVGFAVENVHRVKVVGSSYALATDNGVVYLCGSSFDPCLGHGEQQIKLYPRKLQTSKRKRVILDPSKCSKLSMDEMRELVYELSKRTSRALEMLQLWIRQKILQFDDKEDPSLWLNCHLEPPFPGNSCGMSCHLEKVNDLIGCWRKQMMAAKDTRMVDILYYHVSLEHKLLNSIEKYRKLSEIVDEVVKKPEAKVVEFLDKMLFNTISHFSPNYSVPGSLCSISPAIVRFEEVSQTSVTMIVNSEEPLRNSSIAYNLWHWKTCNWDYPVESTCTMFVSNTRFVVMGLTPAMKSLIKIVLFNYHRSWWKRHGAVLNGETVAIHFKQRPYLELIEGDPNTLYVTIWSGFSEDITLDFLSLTLMATFNADEGDSDDFMSYEKRTNPF